jgi:hypothetical protein
MTDFPDHADQPGPISAPPGAAPARPDAVPPPPDAVPARPDPVLVRPYIGAVPEQPARDPADAPTMIVPAIVDEPEPEPAPPGRRPRRRGRGLALRLLALAGGVAVALGVAGWLIFAPPHDDTQPGATLPQYRATLPADPTGGASARASHSPSASPSSSSASPSASVSAPVSAGVSAGTPSVTAPATATLAPPPASDRSGSVKAASGRCLAMGGLLGLDGSPVMVTGCADLPAQKFTLAADGTLRVSGRCAQTAGDGTVHVQQCGDSAAAQWRSGPSNTLVNPSSGQCLTDPGQLGATTKVAACSGSSDQSWAVP